MSSFVYFIKEALRGFARNLSTTLGSIITIFFNLAVVVLAVSGIMSTGIAVATSLSSVFFCLFNYTVVMFLFGALTTFTEWDNILASTSMKIRSMFTFPLFMLTYIPIALVALVKKATWKPIKHNISVNVDEFATATDNVSRA